MAVELFTDGIEPDDLNAPIWRFLELWKFEDLLKGHLYFRRSDKLDDGGEGLPLDNYENLPGRSRYDLNDISERKNQLGFDAQIRQGFYTNCWYLAGEERAQMWHTYSKDAGVAVCSTYAQLKKVLEPLADDRPHLGLVRYGTKHLTPGRRNLIVNISTKHERYEAEKEVRAMLWIVNPHETGNRHYDLDNRPRDRPIYPTTNPEGVWRPVDLERLVTEVIVSPYAEGSAVGDVERMIIDSGHAFDVKPSPLTRFAALLP